jgi:uncharacterized protein (DUF934 family)
MPTLLDHTGAVIADDGAPSARFTTAATLEEIVPAMAGNAVVTIEFPVFRDGRGFSLARALREHHGYTGAIRAAGHIIADQYAFLVRCGFTQVELPDGADPAEWRRALSVIAIAYQPGYGPEETALGWRRFGTV